MAVSLRALTLQNSIAVAKGGGGASGPISSALSVSTTTGATVANTTETDLWTYTLPANTLSANGKALRISLYGSLGATGNNKTLKFYVGGVLVATFGPTAGNNVTWSVVTTIIRTGAAAEIAKSQSISGSAVLGSGGSTALTSDLTAAVIIKITGTNGTAAANDIVFECGIVEALN